MQRITRSSLLAKFHFTGFIKREFSWEHDTELDITPRLDKTCLPCPLFPQFSLSLSLNSQEICKDIESFGSQE